MYFQPMGHGEHEHCNDVMHDIVFCYMFFADSCNIRECLYIQSLQGISGKILWHKLKIDKEQKHVQLWPVQVNISLPLNQTQKMTFGENTDCIEAYCQSESCVPCRITIREREPLQSTFNIASLFYSSYTLIANPFLALVYSSNYLF